MKNNYKFIFAVALMFALSLQQSFGQLVFSDNFNGTAVAPIATSGTPTMTYTQTINGGTGAGNGAAIILKTGSYVDNYLQITDGTTTGANGETYVTGPLSTYSTPITPFNTMLSSNTQIVQWTFNVKVSIAATGFDPGKIGVAAVLAADNPNLATANGYAVVYGADGFRNFQLVYFTGGLAANANLHNIINSGVNDFTAGKATDFMSIRVTFNPLNKVWQLFWRDDLATVWADPTSGVTAQESVNTADSTYTSTAMSVYGYLWNYTSTKNLTAQFDNFAVTLTPQLVVSPSSLPFSNQAVGTTSDAQTFNISGYYLTGNILVTAPSSDFQVSSDGITWGATATITNTYPTLASTPVYVRFTPQSTSVSPGNITFSGAGVISYSPTVALSGTGVTGVNWINSAGGSWVVPTNWSTGVVPTTNDVVTFNGPYSVTVTNVPTGSTYSSLSIGTASNVANVTLSNSGATTIATSLSNTGNALQIVVGSSLTLLGAATNFAMTLNFSTSNTAGSTGIINRANIGGTLNLSSNGLGQGTYTATNSTTTVGGIFTTDVNGTITSTATNLIFANGGTFKSIATNTKIPIATWSTGSTCELDNTSGNLTAANLGQSFYNFTVNASALSASLTCNGGLTTVNGDLDILNTAGTALFRLATTQPYTLTIGGSLNIYSNAEMDMSSGTATGAQVINIGGDFSISSTGKLIRTSGAQTGTINFNAISGTQHFTCVPSTGINTSTITWNVGDGVTTTNTLQLLSGFIMSTASSLNVLTNATLDCETSVVQATTAGTLGSFTLNSGANLLIGSAGGINTIGTNSGNIQTGTLRSFSATANYTYNGGVVQVTGNAVSTFNANLIISNTAGTPTVTLSNSITSNGTVYFNGGKLVMNGQTLTLNGNVSGGSTSNCITGDAIASLNIGGSNNSLGTLYIDNSSSVANEFNTITMNRTGTNPLVTLGTNISVLNTLTLTTGVITPAASTDTVIIKSSAYNAVIATGANAPNFTLSWINGNLKRSFSSGSINTYNFPVGSSTYPRLAAVQSNGLTGISYFTASFGSLLPGNNAQLIATENSLGSSPFTHYTSVNPAGSWIIEPDIQPTGGNYNISLYFNGFAALLDNQFGILKRPVTSTNYVDFKTGGTLNANGGAGRMVANGYALRMGITSFSEFAIGQSGNVLPIQLVSFTAEKCDNNADALLQWNTASELNNDHFDIESATATLSDGELNFTTIGEVKGNGTSDVGHSYTFTDTRVNKSGTYYYRLKQVDTDSSESYSNMQALLFEGGNAIIISLYPNPNNGQFSINFSTPLAEESSATIEVINLLGQTLFSQAATLSSGSSTNTVTLGTSVTPGIYFTRITVGSNVYVTKLNITGE